MNKHLNTKWLYLTQLQQLVFVNEVVVVAVAAAAAGVVVVAAAWGLFQYD